MNIFLKLAARRSRPEVLSQIVKLVFQMVYMSIGQRIRCTNAAPGSDFAIERIEFVYCP